MLVGPAAGTAPAWGPVVVCAAGWQPPTAVLPAARQWAERLRCPLRFITVSDRPAAKTATTPLHALAQELRADGIDAELEVLTGNQPAEQIERYAATHDATLVAMPTHARAGVKRAVLGSVTMAVVHHAACPVLVTAAP